MAPRPATIIEVRRGPSPADLGAHDLQGEVLGQVVPMAGLPAQRSRFPLGGTYALVPDLGDTELPTPWAFRELDEEVVGAARRAADPDPERIPVATGDPAFTPRPTAEVQADLEAVDELIDRLNADRNGLRFVLRQRGEEG